MVTKEEEIDSGRLFSENEWKYFQDLIVGIDESGAGGALSDEEKLKVALAATLHSPTCSLPSTEDWPGPYEFEIIVNSANANKKIWLYSTMMNKIFIDRNKSIPLQFKINCPDDGESFSIRALPVYTVSQHMTFPVNRCPLHLKEDETQGNGMLNHVVRCGDPRATYECDEESKRYSVITPLGCPQPGSDVVTHMYSFACKSSCCGGMNRRPIMVIFTLEKDKLVVGRKVIHFRVCSSPKRDKEKEEKSTLEDSAQMHPGKKPMEPLKHKDCNPVPSKKRKSLFASSEDSSATTKVYQVTIHGTAHYREILRHLIMLKCAEHNETGSSEALTAKAEYEELWRQSFL